MNLPPGLLVSAPNSGAGKTTFMLGLLRALRERGLSVQPFKSGPDYIDPAFHLAAAGRPSYNLDSWAMSDTLMQEIAQQSKGADIILAEGSMGLFDGVTQKGAHGYGSTAETAHFFNWPIILVLDIKGQAQSAAATALGFASYQKNLPFAGVILNCVASPRHERLTRLGMEQAGIEVLGVLPRRGDLALPERHLGLIQAVEHPDLHKAIGDYASFIAENVDINRIIELGEAKTFSNPLSGASAPPPGQHIALARDEAFSFTYPHLLSHWREQGAQISYFSPLANEPPNSDADVIWLAGGYPELHAGQLASADKCFDAIRSHAKTRPVHGECGGYMVLGKSLIDKNGTAHKMLGLLGLVTSYEKRKFHLGYRKATAICNTKLFIKNSSWRGHEFHYSQILSQPDDPLFTVIDASGDAVQETGSVRGHVTGTFFHLIAKAD
jgi:cobyrinic acid a,c-diamide synthase